MPVKSTNIFIVRRLSELQVTPAQCGWVHMYGSVIGKLIFAQNFAPSSPSASLFATYSRFTEAVSRKYFVKKLFLKIPQNSQKNTSARVSFLINLQALSWNVLIKRLWHICFPVKFARFLRTPIFIELLRWLLLRTPEAATGGAL